MIVVFGRLADIFGRREMYLLGFAVFTVASFLAGLAQGLAAREGKPGHVVRKRIAGEQSRQRGVGDAVG